MAVHLKAANAKQMIAGQTTDLFADLDLTAERRAGDDYTVALKHERAIDRQAKIAGRCGPRA